MCRDCELILLQCGTKLFLKGGRLNTICALRVTMLPVSPNGYLRFSSRLRLVSGTIRKKKRENIVHADA